MLCLHSSVASKNSLLLGGGKNYQKIFFHHRSFSKHPLSNLPVLRYHHNTTDHSQARKQQQQINHSQSVKNKNTYNDDGNAWSPIT